MAQGQGDGIGVRGLSMPRPVARQPIGAVLRQRAALSAHALDAALDRKRQSPARLGEILISQGAVTEAALADAVAFQHGLEWVDLAARLPDPRVCAGIDPADCLRIGFVPAWRVGNALQIVTAWPDRLAEIAAALPKGCGPIRLAYAPEPAIQRAVAWLWRDQLARLAEARCPQSHSCRGWSPRARRLLALGFLAALTTLLAVDPLAIGWVIFALSVVTVLANTALKLAAAGAALSRPEHPRPDPPVAERDLPLITLLIPLLREATVLPRLLSALEALDYPRERLDTCLVVEDDDHDTRAALVRFDPPPWIRSVTVPAGTLRTKPRAMNFALDFSRGSVIGVYDAEDAPAPDQLRRVIARFAAGGPELACVQGMLDFYNSRSNWLSRCFTIEYAFWFRIVLRGLSVMGLPFPLGGTTMFVRRDVLAAIGAWDAHNVTEDADLGIRLARHGYRTEVIDSITREEANNQLWPWIRQRSRWIKGFAMTWGTHMRRPRALLRDLGWPGFLTFQVLFLGAVGSYLLAPFLWLMWLLPATGQLPFLGPVPFALQALLLGLFILSELVNITLGVVAIRKSRHRFLWPWVPTCHLYFPIGAIAAWRAFYELIVQPFYWSKTPHGLAEIDADICQDTDTADAAAAPDPGRMDETVAAV